MALGFLLLMGAVLLGSGSPGCQPAAADAHSAGGPGDAGPESGKTPAAVAVHAANNRDFLDIARTAIGQAKVRLHLVEFVIYDSGPVAGLLDLLIAAAERGVEVKVLADDAAPETAAALARLAGHGIAVKQDSPRVTTHNKLVIADDQTLVGSHNFTSAAIEQNNEASLLVDDPRTTDYFERYFQALWADPVASPVLRKEDSPPITPLSDREIAAALQACLDGARARIRVVLYAMCYRPEYPGSDSNRLVDRLVAARRDGLDVEVVLDRSDWVTENGINDAAVARLVAAGVPLRLTPSGEVTHAKMLLCDQTVLVSDANWCHSALAGYHGTSVRVQAAALAATYEAWFASIWERSSAPASPAP